MENFVFLHPLRGAKITFRDEVKLKTPKLCGGYELIGCDGGQVLYALELPRPGHCPQHVTAMAQQQNFLKTTKRPSQQEQRSSSDKNNRSKVLARGDKAWLLSHGNQLWSVVGRRCEYWDVGLPDARWLKPIPGGSGSCKIGQHAVFNVVPPTGCAQSVGLLAFDLESGALQLQPECRVIGVAWAKTKSRLLHGNPCPACVTMAGRSNLHHLEELDPTQRFTAYLAHLTRIAIPVARVIAGYVNLPRPSVRSFLVRNGKAGTLSLVANNNLVLATLCDLKSDAAKFVEQVCQVSQGPSHFVYSPDSPQWLAACCWRDRLVIRSSTIGICNLSTGQVRHVPVTAFRCDTQFCPDMWFSPSKQQALQFHYLTLHGKAMTDTNGSNCPPQMLDLKYASIETTARLDELCEDILPQLHTATVGLDEFQIQNFEYQSKRSAVGDCLGCQVRQEEINAVEDVALDIRTLLMSFEFNPWQWSSVHNYPRPVTILRRYEHQRYLVVADSAYSSLKWDRIFFVDLSAALVAPVQLPAHAIKQESGWYFVS